jgi:hypothetical protein
MELERDVLGIDHGIRETIQLEKDIFETYSKNSSKSYCIVDS